MPDNVMFFDSAAGWEVIDDKVQRQIVGYNESVMMVNVRFLKDGIGSLHHHYHTQVTHVTEGKFEVTINNEKKVLKKGDSFFVAPNVVHGVVCLESGMLTDVFSPMREDFINNMNVNSMIDE